MPARTVTTDERRARVGRRHRLVDAAETIEQTTDDLVVLHATDPATIYLTLSARLPDCSVADIEDALFERRTMARTLAMRRTLFVPTLNVIGEVERSSSGEVARVERRRLAQYLSESDVADPESWLNSTFDAVLRALDGPSGLAARAITAAVPVLGTKLVMGPPPGIRLQRGQPHGRSD